ncbi:MAG: protein-disulfide isomerase [Alphaproteobacteria bacterium]|nr:MAG: protein-disulfide isomerase [Alphaproteobacteria bacterium]
MKLHAVIAIAAAAATVALPAAALAQDRIGPGFGGARPRGPQGHDWRTTAERTPEGGFRIGNPNARVKVVEYFSTTCPHCATFAHESADVLIGDYVRSGRVSLEYRNYYLNGVDIAAALLSRCAQPRQYFEMSHALLGTQPQWMGRVNAITPAQRTELQALPPLEVARRLISMLGLDAIGQRYGITPQVRAQCLTQANLDQLDALHSAGGTAGVTGTPTFFVNGRLVQENNWAGIQPLLRAQ